MAANQPPQFHGVIPWIKLKVSEKKTVDITNHIRGSGPISVFAGTPDLDWVTVKNVGGRKILEVKPTPSLKAGYPTYKQQVEARSVHGTAFRIYQVLLSPAIKPRWRFRNRHVENISENAMDSWDLTREVSGDGEITLSLHSEPSWVRLNGFILTYKPPELTEGEYKNYAIRLRAKSDYGQSDRIVILRVENDGAPSIGFDLPDDREEVAEDTDFSFETSSFVEGAIGTVTYFKIRGSEWLDVDENTGRVTGRSPLVDNNENHHILIEVRDSQGTDRSNLLVTVTDSVVVPDDPDPDPDDPEPSADSTWLPINLDAVPESTEFSIPMAGFLRTEESPIFSLSTTTENWIAMDAAGTLTNATGQMAPSVTRDTDYKFTIEATLTNPRRVYSKEFILTISNTGTVATERWLDITLDPIPEDSEFSIPMARFLVTDETPTFSLSTGHPDWVDMDSDGTLKNAAGKKSPRVGSTRYFLMGIDATFTSPRRVFGKSFKVTIQNTGGTDPANRIQWGTIPVIEVDELKSFSRSISDYLTGTTTARFSKHAGATWITIDSVGQVKNVTGQTPPDVTSGTHQDYTVTARAIVGNEIYDADFTIRVKNLAGLKDPSSNAPPMIQDNIPDFEMDELTYGEFSIDSYVSGGTSGGAVVIRKDSGASWLTITGGGNCSGTPDEVPSDTKFPFTFSALSVFGHADNGKFNVIVKNRRVSRKPPTWDRTIPPIRVNSFSRFNKNIRRFVSGSGLIELTKISGESWIRIDRTGNRLTGTTPKTRTEQQYAVTVRARSVYGSSTRALLFIVNGDTSTTTNLTFTPPDFTMNEKTMLNEDLSSYVSGATGTVRFQVNYPLTGFRIVGTNLQYTAGDIDLTQYISVFLRAYDTLGGVTRTITVIVRNTDGGGLPIVDEGRRALPLSTASISAPFYNPEVDEIVYNAFLYQTTVLDPNAEADLGDGDMPDLPQEAFFGNTVSPGTWTRFPDQDIINFGNISSSLDTVDVNVYRVNQMTIELENQNEFNGKYSPKNPNNYFYQNYGDRYGYGMPIYVDAGYQTPEGVRVERIFEGIITDITHDVSDKKVIVQLSDDSQYLKNQIIRNFGNSQRLILDTDVDFMTDEEKKQFVYSFYSGFTPVSDGSVNPIYPPNLELVDNLNTFGRLSPLKMNATDEELRTETIGPSGTVRYQIEFKSPYRYKKFETIIQDLAEDAGIDNDRIKMLLPKIVLDQSTFSSLGRPGYELLHNYEQLRSRVLAPFRWDGFVTDIHYDQRDGHEKYYFLVSSFTLVQGGGIGGSVTDDDDAAPSDQESIEYLTNLDENFGYRDDSQERKYINETEFGAYTSTQMRFHPKIVQYDEETDQYKTLVTRSEPAEWWKMEPNDDYTKWYVLGTNGEHRIDFLNAENGGQFARQRPIQSTYDVATVRSPNYGTFIEIADMTTDPSSVVSFLDRSSDYPPQLAHLYHVGYGVTYIGPDGNIELDNRPVQNNLEYVKDGTKGDSRRPIIWRNGRLYYPFVRNRNNRSDFGVASTANGTSFTTPFNPIPKDKNENWMGFSFDIKGNVLEFAFTAMTGSYPTNANTTFKVIRETL